MDPQHGGELAAGRNAVAGAQIARMDERAQLIAKLDVQRDVALRLEMKWQHCLSPGANFTRYWAGARANFSTWGDWRILGGYLILEGSADAILPGRSFLPRQVYGGISAWDRPHRIGRFAPEEDRVPAPRKDRLPCPRSHPPSLSPPDFPSSRERGTGPRKARSWSR